MKNEELRAKARFLRLYNNPGLKSGVIDNEIIKDFSPECVFPQTPQKLSSSRFSRFRLSIP